MDIFDLSPEELIILAALAAQNISKGLIPEEIDLIAWFLESVASNLGIFAIKETLDDEISSRSDESTKKEKKG